MQAIPAKFMALTQAMSPKATMVAFGDSNTTPRTPRKRIRTQCLTRPHTNAAFNHERAQSLNYTSQTHWNMLYIASASWATL